MSNPVREVLPFLGFWRGPTVLWADVAAGLTVGMVLVPQAMAYAALVGMPPETGLYAASFACMVGAAFGRCAQVNTGPVAMTSLLSFAALAPLADPGSSNYLALAAVLAVMVGVLRIGIGLVRGTALVALISQPVLAGFTAAAGLTIAATQVPKFFQLPKQSDNPIFNVLIMVSKVGESHWPSLLMGVGTLLLMIAFKRWLPRLPGLLISMVIATLISWFIDFPSLGGHVVGDLPSGLPPFSLPVQGWNLWVELLPGAFLVSIIGLLEVMTVTTAAERKTGRSTSLDGEIVGQGMASLCAGFNSGFPVSGSLSRSSLNMLAGAQTGLSSVVSGLVVVLTLLVLTPLLEPIPYPALAAAIVMAVSALFRPQDILSAWRVRKVDGILGGLTLLGTVLAAPDMVVGMALGVGASIAVYLFRAMRPRVILLSRDEDGRWSNIGDHPEEALQDGALVFRVDSRLSFLNARLTIERIKAHLLSHPEGVNCILNASPINDIDATGAMVLKEFLKLVRDRNGTLVLADTKAPIREMLENHPDLKRLRYAPTVEEAVKLLQAMEKKT